MLPKTDGRPTKRAFKWEVKERVPAPHTAALYISTGNLFRFSGSSATVEYTDFICAGSNLGARSVSQRSESCWKNNQAENE